MPRQIREVKVSDLLKYSIGAPMLIALIWTLTPIFLVDLIPIPKAITYTVVAIFTYYPLKWFAIGAVLVYKAFAPMSLRNRCLFTPTCSSYMIMAIYKYGLFVGVFKGIRRITRCRPPNGGEDYP